MFGPSHNPLSPDLSGQAQVRLPAPVLIAYSLNRGERDGESAACLTFEDHHQNVANSLTKVSAGASAPRAPLSWRLLPLSPLSPSPLSHPATQAEARFASCSAALLLAVRWRSAAEDAFPTTPSQTTNSYSGGLFCFVCWSLGVGDVASLGLVRASVHVHIWHPIASSLCIACAEACGICAQMQITLTRMSGLGARHW